MSNVPNRAKKIAENFNRLSRVHERYKQTDRRQTDGRTTTYSVRSRSCSLKQHIAEVTSHEICKHFQCTCY